MLNFCLNSYPFEQKLILLPSEKKEVAGHPDTGKTQPLLSNGYVSKDLALADSEHLGAAYRTCAISRQSTILHGYTLGILHLPLRVALDKHIKIMHIIMT
jgi:hypothetical protein